MRITKVLLGCGIIIFATFFFDAFSSADRVGVIDGRTGLQAFELFGAVVSLYLLSRVPGDATVIDWLSCTFAILVASIGFAGFAITLFALYLFLRDRDDLNTKAAGTVAAAVAVQAVWAPLIFSKISFLLLQVDAGAVGWLVSFLVPATSWSGTIVSTPSGHEVALTEPCASFHNLSLASLCWVTLTMLHRPYWVRSDIYIGLVAVLIQIGCNICRLVMVCLSLPMYEFWHEGSGKHIFSAIATACAIIFVQAALIRLHQRDHQPTECRAAATS